MPRRIALIAISITCVILLIASSAEGDRWAPSKRSAGSASSTAISTATPRATGSASVVYLAAWQTKSQMLQRQISMYRFLSYVAFVTVIKQQQQAAYTQWESSQATLTSPASASPVASSASTTVQSTGGGDQSVWQCIISRESGGNPSAVNPSSGAGGLFQFLPSSFAAYGGVGLPEDASVGEQWAVAEHAYAVSGWSPWIGDGCTPLG
jgi:resuscitation-promoting factor RpfC